MADAFLIYITKGQELKGKSDQLALFGVGSNGKATREQFERLQIGMSERELQEVMQGHVALVTGTIGEAEFQKTYSQAGEFAGIMFVGDLSVMRYSKVTLSPSDGRLNANVIWDPTVRDVLDRWSLLAKWRLGLY